MDECGTALVSQSENKHVTFLGDPFFLPTLSIPLPTALIIASYCFILPPLLAMSQNNDIQTEGFGRPIRVPLCPPQPITAATRDPPAGNRTPISHPPTLDSDPAKR